MDPSDEVARQGLLQIPARYAILAERDIADNNYDSARGYIGIGLQVDPNNQTLLVLRDLAVTSRVGFFASLVKLFQ